MAEECWSGVDSTLLGEDDLPDTIRELADVAASWRNIGIFLRVRDSWLKAIQGDKPLDCLRQMLAIWLQKNYNVKRFGEPTWVKLVEAVNHPAGGGNPSLAMEIAKRHGVLGKKADREREIRELQQKKEELEHKNRELQRQKEELKEELQQQQDKYKEQIQDLEQQLHDNVCIQHVSPQRCYATGEGLEVAMVGEPTTAVVHAVDNEGRACNKPLGNIKCELISEATGVVVGYKVEKRNSQYEISYQPTHRGKHQLSIRVGGIHIRGSPFTVEVETPSHLGQRNQLFTVSLVHPMVFHLIVLASLTAIMVKFPIQNLNTPIQKLGTQIQTSDGGFQPWGITLQRLGIPIKIIGGLSKPWGVAVSNNGEIAVAEWGGHCVSIFYQNGTKIRTFGKEGGQFNHPHDVSYDIAGNLLVADRSNHRIQKFTTEGKFFTAVGKHGNGQLEFNYPSGIGINHKNKKVFICDQWNHRVQILNEDLTFSSSFGGSGSDDRQFSYPWDAAFDSTGSVYIADSGNHRIQVFTPEGRFLRKFGRKGSGEGELKWPSSISIDSNDIVYVAERDNNRVSIFTSLGKFIRSFGTKGARPGEFIEPCGIAVDTSGLVYVSESYNDRIQIF